MVFKKERLALSVREVSFLKSLSANFYSIGQLAKNEGVTSGFASQIVKSLKRKGLVSVELKWPEHIVQISESPLGQSLKQLVNSRPQAKIEDWLSGNALQVLVLTANPKGLKIAQIAKEGEISVPTVYREVKKLQAAGVVVREGVAVRVSDAFVASFANQYADNLQMNLLFQIGGRSIGKRIRKHSVFRNNFGSALPEFVSVTGLNALNEAGLEAILPSTRDLYFNLDQKRRKLSLEEHFIHALLLTSMQQHQDDTVLSVFLAKNGRKLDRSVLKALAEEYSVESELSNMLQTMRAAVDLANKLNK